MGKWTGYTEPSRYVGLSENDASTPQLVAIRF